MKKRANIFIGLFLGLVLLLRGTTLYSSYWVNKGMSYLLHSLVNRSDFVPDAYPNFAVLDKTLATEQILTYLLPFAINLTPKWAYSRVALAVGEPDTAANMLMSITEQVNDNPLLYQDLLVALLHNQMFEQIKIVYETNPMDIDIETVNDAVALAYLRTGDKSALETVARLRPKNIYVNFLLWRGAKEIQNELLAEKYQKELTGFPLEAISPSNDYLFDYIAQTIPLLLENGIWQHETTVNVVSYLVWQHYEINSIKKLLEDLIILYPYDFEWPYYLAELYHRRGDMEHAESFYNSAFEIDPTSDVLFRLGLVNETQGDMEEASYWYVQYSETNPEDQIGLLKLKRVDQLLNGTDTSIENGLFVFGDSEFVANKLGLSINDVTVGPNMLHNGSFEEVVQKLPTFWRIPKSIDVSEGIFFVGVDNLITPDGLNAVRIDRVWEKEDNSYFGIVAEQDFIDSVYAFQIEPHQLYLISGMYRTNQERAASIYLGNPYVNLIVSHLPPTDRSWKRIELLGCQSTDITQSMQLILHSIDQGPLWFDDIKLRTVDVPNMSEICTNLPDE